MDLKYANEKNLKTLEDYAVFLVTGMLTIQTLYNVHVKALKEGILTEELAERVTNIEYDLMRLLKLYQKQSEDVLALVPDDFNAESIINKLKDNELKIARKMVRNGKKFKVNAE